jgi:tetratricopeptide (TPR) repeat protein
MTSYLAAVLTAAVPCPPAGDTPPDREAAEAYVAVAELELTRGARDTARAALCAALEANPGDPRALALLAATDEDDVSPPLEAALASMKQGRWREALEAARAPALVNEPAARLVEGLCLLELGELDAARAALLRAREAPEQRALVDLYLGLVAFQRGDTAEAASRLDGVTLSDDDRLQRVVGDLQRLSRVDGRFTVLAGVFPGFDSNVDATPTGSTYAVSAAAPDLSVFGVLWARPFGRSGPFARVRAQHRALFRVTDFTATVLEASGGWNHVTRTFRLRGEYDFEALWLAGANYRLLHAAQLSAERYWRTVTLSALWSGRRQDFLSADLSPFSGWQHTGFMQLGWAPNLSFNAWLGWTYLHDLPVASQLNFIETGPRLGLEVRPLDRLRLALLVTPTLRQYLSYDAVLGEQRRDLRLEGQLVVTLQLLEVLALQAAAGGLVARSTVDLFSFERFTASLGLVFSFGVP